MPLYDFRCRACSTRFETLVMGSEIPCCPQCRSRDLEKEMSTFAFRSTAGDQRRSTSGSKCSGCAGGSCSTCH